MDAKVSIIMGIYNCEHTLAEAIDSILSQTFTAWKLIMCDDGSTDGTLRIALEYRDKYPEKIFVIKNENNKGSNATLNHCLEYADTEYVARMDGDDISLPTRLETEYNFLESHPEYSIVSTPMIYFDENGDWGRGKGHGEVAPKSAVHGTPFCHAPCMVRKSAYDAVGGYTVDDKYLRVEDYELWIKMLAKGFKGFNLDEPLYKMRDDRNATTRRNNKARINEARVKIKAVNTLGLNKLNYIYAIKPILLIICPTTIYERLHKKGKNK